MKKRGKCGRENKAMALKGLRVLIIRKKSPEDVIISRLREYLLYSKLRSLVPPSQPLQIQVGLAGGLGIATNTAHLQHQQNFLSNSFVSQQLISKPHSWAASKYNTQQHEFPNCDSYHDNSNAMPEGVHAKSKGEGECGSHIYGYDDDDDNDETSRPFVPSIKIKRMDKILLISAVVCKDVATSSALFRVLEEEKLDIVHENQYRTETKVCYTIQARLHSELDSAALKEKLLAWARKA